MPSDDTGGAALPADPRRNWITKVPTEDEPRALKHELVRELKRAIERTALLDVRETALADLSVLVEAARALADRLDPLPNLLKHGGAAAAPTDDAALSERSGVSGRSNPLAPPMTLEIDGDVVRGSAVYTEAYEGPIGCLHGGFVAAAFDDLLGCAQLASGHAGYTGTLTVRLRAPTPLHERIDYEAGVDRVEGRKIFTWGTARHGDTLLAEAEGVFIAPRDGELPR